MRNWFNFSTTACAVALCGATFSAHAADTKVDKTESETVLRAYDVMGMNVRNAQGEKLGDIKDLMVDMGRHPRVRYAALDFGGFLGIGDKLFAVPWQALKLRHDAKDNDRAFLELDATKESLKNAPGFDKDAWPNFADNRWADEVHKHYRVSTPAAKVDVDVNRKNPATTSNGQSSALLRRASKVEGIEVKNAADQKIGKVEDLVLEVGTGEVRYFALSFGGFLGIGDKLFAVPWEAVMFEYSAKDKEDCLMFDVSKETLSNASGFDKDHWPNFGDAKWKVDNRRHYQKNIDRASSRAKERRG